MTTDIAAPPFLLDVRVAQSPLVGLRYAVDGRTTDVDDVIAQLEEARDAAIGERDGARTRLRPYEESRRALIEWLSRNRTAEMRARLEEAMELRTLVARLDERATCLQGRIDDLRQQRFSLHELSGMLAGVDNLHTASIDGLGAAQNQAVRQLYHLIDTDHDITAQHILEGPMQMLADAALHTELVGRAADGDAGTAVAVVAKCRTSTNAALSALHQVVFDIHPDQLEEQGLIATLRRLLGGMTDVHHDLLVLGRPRRLRSTVDLALFRIVQEAVGNSVEHGKATRIDLILLYQQNKVSLVVRDDGEGFDVAATEARLGRGTGLGLITMRQRAEIENGHLEVRSVVGDGTEVRASFSAPD